MFDQITVFVENKPGRLEEVVGTLADNRINLHALSLADTTDFGIIRLIVSEPDRAVNVLKEKNLMVKTTEVIAIGMGHNPGELHAILRKLKALDISIEYMYAFTTRHEQYAAVVVLRVANQDAVLEKIRNSEVNMVGKEMIG